MTKNAKRRPKTLSKDNGHRSGVLTMAANKQQLESDQSKTSCDRAAVRERPNRRLDEAAMTRQADRDDDDT